MSKKRFNGMDAMLNSSKEDEDIAANDQIQRQKKEIRTSLSIDSELLESLHAVAFWERIPLKDSWETAVKNYLESKPAKELQLAKKQYLLSKRK
jgi:hypothetical protein